MKSKENEKRGIFFKCEVLHGNELFLVPNNVPLL